MGTFDEGLALVWAGAPNEALRLIVQAFRDFLSKGAPNEALRMIEQALRNNRAVFATGGFDKSLTLVWAGAPNEALRLIMRALRDNQAILCDGWLR